MAQRIFQSFRRLPGHLASVKKKVELAEVHGCTYKINVCADYGFPSKPTSIAYDCALDLLALLTRDGNLYVFGKPGVVFTGTHNCEAEFIQVLFITGERKLVTLTSCDDLYLWELTSVAHSFVRILQLFRLQGATSGLRPGNVTRSDSLDGDTDEADTVSHITSICCTSDSRSLLIGTDHGWVASIRLNSPSKSGTTSETFEYFARPTSENAILPNRILDSLPSSRHNRIRLDAVVVLSERPGFPGQLLIGYSSGVCVLFDLKADRVIALLPWKHGLEAAAWCGGSGFPHRASTSDSPPHLGMRLLTAHSDGSLGVWNLKDVGFTTVASPPSSEPHSLGMEEPPTMPYGPFPCKLISKVFWLVSPYGGTTAFVGGMPRSTYGERHTVSLLRGSNLDRAAAANATAARVAAAAELDDDDDDDLLDSDPLTSAPIHVFDPDAPEHVCFDLPSRLVDLLPIGPPGGPAEALLILCEEELVAVDLLTQGWPFMRPPYLACLHATTVTTYNLVTQVNPTFLSLLTAAGICYGPEGRFGRGSNIVSGPNATEWSQRPWPIQGGQALVSGSRLSSYPAEENLFFTDDLLLTGHEDGSVAFWRLSAGGCFRRVYTLHTAILFEGDFGTSGHANELDDDADSWPPFRQAGVFDPFIDDNRASVQVIKLVDNTVIVGGAAGQVTVWQFLNHSPPLLPAQVVLKAELPGFQWKGHSPLKLKADVAHGNVQSNSPPQLQAIGVLMIQPPGRCTSLGLTEIPPLHRDVKSHSSPSTHCSIGVLVAFGTPHGYGVVFLRPSKPPPASTDQSVSPPVMQWEPMIPLVLLAETTLPDNLDALQEAAAGEGWARRRTRELKKSLRDSFRRLKRMRSTKTATTEIQSAHISRAGIRRTVTQNNRAIGRTVNSGPLEDAESRVMSLTNTPVHTSSGFPPVSIEREICDRPVESASTAIVSCFAFGPPLFRFSTHPSNQTANYPVGSLFVGTKAGIVKAYALFADQNMHSSNRPSTFRLQLAKQLILQHRAPLLSLRLVDGKSYFPYSPYSLDPPSNSPLRSTVLPCLLVTTEEQIRLFSLPALRLRYKARITAKDGYRIKASSLVSFRVNSKIHPSNDKSTDVDSACADLDKSAASSASTPSHHLSVNSDMHNSEFSLVFTNVGGQAVVLSVPHLTRKDTFGLLDLNDVVAVSSVVFAESGCSCPSGESTVFAPSLGLYQLAPGQLTLFDVVRTGQRSSLLGASYRPIHRLPQPNPGHTGRFVQPTITEPHTTTINGPSSDSFASSSSYRLLQPVKKSQQPYSSHSTTGHSGSYTSSQVNSSLLSNTLSDSVRDCLSSPSGSSVVSDQHSSRR